MAMVSTNPELSIDSEQQATKVKYSIVINCRSQLESVVDQKSVLTEILNALERKKIALHHLETRDDTSVQEDEKTSGFSCLLLVCCTHEVLNEYQKYLLSISGISKVNIIEPDANADHLANVWIPKHVSELDKCRHLLVKFQPELQTDHPGFNDLAYRNRRQRIAQLAFDHRYGDPLPEVEYTSEELQTWRQVYEKVNSLHKKWACKEYMEGLKLLETFCGFAPDHIPQLRTVSDYLERTSGFRLRPVAGLVDPRDFLAHFAFRVFPCTQYIRHYSRPFHTPEPDCIHELLGHMPLLTNRKFADFCHQIGLVSLGATDEEIKRIATVFWFTVEFGLCLEDGETKALGAGILSAYGELENAFSTRAELRPFNPHVTAIQPYDDIGYQPVYFVCDSIERMKQQFQEYVVSLRNNCRPHYDPYTNTVEMLTVNKLRRKLLKEVRQSLDQMGATV